MQIHMTGRQLRLTDSIRAYVEEKVRRAEKYFNHLIWAQVTLSVQKRTHSAEIVIHAPGQTFRALAKAADLYAAIDLASDKVDQQLKKHKEKVKKRHKAPAPRLEEAVSEAAPRGRVAVVKHLPLQPMSRDDAAQALERAGSEFWVFHDSETGQVSVLYRRGDDSYGVLLPVKKGR